MTIIPIERKKVTERQHVWVSRHFHYSDFGVRDTDKERRYGLRFVCTGTPGSGFIERSCDSQSYYDFVHTHRSLRRPTYFGLLFGKEPSYDRELRRANALMCSTDDPRKRVLMECYTNALSIGRREEEIQRVILSLKKKMRHHHNKHLVSIVSHYQHRISQLERDMDTVEYHLKDHCSDEVYEAYNNMMEAFGTMVSRCRRIWHHNEKSKGDFRRVFFDFGIFDFIRNDGFLPLMRDSGGVCYYWLPDALIVARSSVDFDIVPLKGLTVVCQETAIVETTELLSSTIGNAACMILIPELNLTFYFNHARVVVAFVQAVDELKKRL